MNTQSKVTCPACGSPNCLFGSLESGNADIRSTGIFYPANIGKKSLISLSPPKVHTTESGIFWGCFECGLLWSKLNLEQFKEILKKQNWEVGNIQSSAVRPAYISLFLKVAIAVIVLLAMYTANNL